MLHGEGGWRWDGALLLQKQWQRNKAASENASSTRSETQGRRTTRALHPWPTDVSGKKQESRVSAPHLDAGDDGVCLADVVAGLAQAQEGIVEARGLVHALELAQL